MTIFRSRLSDQAGDEYEATAARMLELAQAMPGFISFKSFTAPDGERVSIIEFADEAAQTAWQTHPDHLAAQRRGREAFYAEYRIQVCRPLDERTFARAEEHGHP